jgi:pimeloyl-ACP methyl ester carboxylesterase
MAEHILFIPGLRCTADLFAAQREALAAGHDIVVADIGQDATIAAMAARALAATPGRFAVVGLSMGGYVALEIMRLAPGRVTRLALLDTSARPDTEDATRKRGKMIGLAELGRLDIVHDSLWRRLVAPGRQSDAALEAKVKAMLFETGPEAFIRQQQAIMGRMDSRPSLPAIAAPTLALVGEEDEITPPEHAIEIAKAVPGARLVRIPGSGHLSTLEQPEAVNAALVDHFAQTPAVA